MRLGVKLLIIFIDLVIGYWIIKTTFYSYLNEYAGLSFWGGIAFLILFNTYAWILYFLFKSRIYSYLSAGLFIGVTLLPVALVIYISTL